MSVSISKLQTACLFNSVIYHTALKRNGYFFSYQSACSALRPTLIPMNSEMITNTRPGACSFTSGALGNGSSNGYFWSSAPSDATLAYGFSFNSGNFNSHNANTNNNNYSQRASGKPVRPVQELKSCLWRFFKMSALQTR